MVLSFPSAWQDGCERIESIKHHFCRTKFLGRKVCLSLTLTLANHVDQRLRTRDGGQEEWVNVWVYEAMTVQSGERRQTEWWLYHGSMVLLAAVVDQWRAPLVGLSVDNWCHAGGRAELDKVLRWVAQTTHHAARQSAARVCTGHCTARDSSCRRNANSLSCSLTVSVD